LVAQVRLAALDALDRLGRRDAKGPEEQPKKKQ
jgi:hypothetical protein